ncbi:MAG: methionyl-tRNA formyltransferase [Bacteroidales bacterium]
MSGNGIRIVYMGTPEFAVAPLKALANAGLDIRAVVTAPDKPAGRGKQLKSSAVKEFTLSELNCPLLQPPNLKDPQFIEQLKSLDATLFIVVAFRMLPEAVWRIPKYGTFNLHASLLPQYRGAAPINWCIINGETETGVTTFLIDQEIDTGRIMLQAKTEIGTDDTAGTVHDRLMKLGAELVIRTVESIKQGTADAIDQSAFNIPEDQLKRAPKIFREDCSINWNKSSREIHNLVRGLSPFPGAHTTLQKSDSEKLPLKIFETKLLDETTGKDPGTVISHNRQFLKVATGDGCIGILSLQVAGKKRMSTAEFIRGFQDELNDLTFLSNS